MRLAGKTITALLVMIFAMASMAMAQQQPAPEMSYRHAQRTIMKAMSYGEVYGEVWVKGPPTHIDNVRLTQDTLEFDAKGESKGVAKDVHFTIPLKELPKLTADCSIYGCWFKEEGGKPLSLTYYNADKRNSGISFGYNKYGKTYSQAQNDEFINAAQQFVAALNSLHIYALRPTTPDEEFHKQAAAWRALAEKPALPDAARVRRLLAEDAIKNKKPEDALMYYEQALEAYPTWPEGWFNAALVAGELRRNDDAVDDMQNYLELVPDAKDAQSARDQMEMWKIKAQTKK